MFSGVEVAELKGARLELARRVLDAQMPAPPPASGQLVLGPVVELTVNDDSAKKDFCVDLDTGRLVTPPADLNSEHEEAVVAWIRSKGVDAMAETSVSVQGLIGFDMVVQPVASELWDSVTAETILTREMLARAPAALRHPCPARVPLPVTYMFKTREGGLGILQIVGFAENPKGVKIRYRMVQAAAPSAAVSEKERANLASFAKALDMFEVDTGRYPTTEEGLQALVTQPPGVPNWHGPYVKLPPGSSGSGEFLSSAPGTNGKPFDLAFRQLTLHPSAAAAQGLTFGDVVELPPNFGRDDNVMVNFASGKVFSHRALGGAGGDAALAAMRSLGVDAGCETTGDGMELTGIDTVFIPCPSEAWDNTTPAGLSQTTFVATDAGLSDFHFSRSKLPATYAFRTREGRFGLLQFVEQADGVRVRYKMVKAAGATRQANPHG